MVPLSIMPILCLVLVSCVKKKEPPRPKPPVPVGVVVAEQRNVPVQLAAIGNVEAYSTVGVKSQISGTIVRVHFREGEDVRKGQVLFTIDPAPFVAALRHAEALLAKDIAQAKNAEEQAKRYATLVQEGIVTREQYDTYRTAAEALGATVAADRAAVENARIQLGYCTIRSPLSGRTGNLAVHAGNLVKANDNPVLVTINQITPIYTTFSIPEKELPEIKRRLASGALTVEARLPNDTGEPERGNLTFIDNFVDPTTGMIKLKGTFQNGKGRLWPGQFVKITMTLSILANATVVPQHAVQAGQKGPFVFVVKRDNTVEQRSVVPGISQGGQVVILQGIQPGESIVTEGQMRVMPGAKVAVRHEKRGGESQAQPSGGLPGHKQ